MNYQHVQTAGTADVIGIKERRLARGNQARQPSSSTTLRPERAPAPPGKRPGQSERSRQSLPSAQTPPAGGLGPACPAWRRSAGSARPPGRPSRCGAASTARPAGSWRCAAPACSCARSAPPPPPSGWRPTGSSRSARYRPLRRPRPRRGSGPAPAASLTPAGWVAARVPGAALASGARGMEGGRGPWESAQRHSGASPAARER